MAKLAERSMPREVLLAEEMPGWVPSPPEGEEPQDDFASSPTADGGLPLLLMLQCWLQTACRLIQAGAPAGSVLQLRLPFGLAAWWDWALLAQMAGCRGVELGPRIQSALPLAEDGVSLVCLPASRVEAEALWSRLQAQADPWIGVWCSEETLPLAGVPAGRVQQLDLTTPACRPWLVRHLWQMQGQRLWQRAIYLSDALLAELCALPLASLQPALQVMGSHPPEELEELATLHELESLRCLIQEGVLPQDAAARQRWVTQVIADELNARPHAFVHAVEDHLHVVIHEPPLCNFEVSTHSRLQGLFLESRCENRFGADQLGSLIAFVNDWNRRSELIAVIEREDGGDLALLLRTRLGWAAESSPAWAQAELERLLQQIHAFWLVEISLLEAGSCRH